MYTQTIYQKTILFAAQKHQEKNQKVPGTQLPYIVHLSNVAMEILMAAPHTEHFNLDFAIQLALLHDLLEDTQTSMNELIDVFGTEVANGVLALTKNQSLPKQNQMTDSIHRIKQLSFEVWAIKMADRITNLQQPPSFWKHEKKIKYQQEAIFILQELKEGNAYLANRLQAAIDLYTHYIEN